MIADPPSGSSFGPRAVSVLTILIIIVGMILLAPLCQRRTDPYNCYPLEGHIYKGVRICIDNPNAQARDVMPRVEIGRVLEADSNTVSVQLNDGKTKILRREELAALKLYVNAADPVLPAGDRHVLAPDEPTPPPSRARQLQL